MRNYPYAILKKLLNEKNLYFTIEDLMLIGWPDRVVSVNSVPVAITNLRKTFKHHTAQKVILNTQNLGYIIGADSDVQIANSSLLTDVAVKENYINKSEKKNVLEWSKAPEKWGK